MTIHSIIHSAIDENFSDYCQPAICWSGDGIASIDPLTEAEITPLMWWYSDLGILVLLMTDGNPSIDIDIR